MSGDRVGGDKTTTGDIDRSSGLAFDRGVAVNISDRPASSKDYLVAIWEYEQRAADTRNWMIVTQVGTVISLVALIVVLWVIGLNFASYVNTQFSIMDDRFEKIERRLDTIDRRIQRIATPEPAYPDYDSP